MARGELEYRILQRAKELKIKTHVEDQLREVKRRINEVQRLEKKQIIQSIDGITNFEPDQTGKGYDNLYCGSWIATEDGVMSQESSKANQTACYHPILPIKRMWNAETSEEQITIAFKRSGFWREITVPKELIANSRRITDLSKYGISVTSETSKLLVKFLADVENYNDDKIPLIQSSSKLGWHGKEFLPYDKLIAFDAALKFPQIIQAIVEHGSYDIWLDHIKKIRASSYVEPRLALAASFSSAIIKFLNIASVIVDFWGMTEAGKTVMLMIAASVWACPDEGLYMGDFLTTDVELEVRSDMLNNLPLILDDTAKMRKNIRDNIEQVIYNLSSGSGKKRSNKELGSERVRTWKNAVIVNGERPLNSFAEQGGAINRIIEVGLSTERLFENPQITAETVRNNYGFAGKIFVDCLKEIDSKEIRTIHSKYRDLLTTDETMQKQVLAMAAILTADELATKYIFHDDKALTANDVKAFLTNRQQVSDGVRCYEYILGLYEEKGQHFNSQHDMVDQWGEIDYTDGVKYLNFYVNAFTEQLRIAGFSRKSFTSWAKREGLLRCNNGEKKDVYTKRISEGTNADGPYQRFISIRMVDLDEYEEERNLFK